MLALASVALILGVVLIGGGYAVARADGVDSRRTVVAVAVLLAAGGVAAQATPAPVSPAPTDESAVVADAADGVPGGGSAEAVTEDSLAPQRAGEGSPPTNATVVAVSAPDRLTYRTESGERRTVRLAGVDAPGLDGADPETFDGVLTGERGRQCLAAQGRRALVSLRTDLLDERVTVRSAEATSGTATAVVAVDGQSVNERLVERGDARATDGRYDDVERRARSAHRGLWSCGVVEPDRPLRGPKASSIHVAAVHPNPPGPDRAALNDEYVVLGNDGDRAIDLSDWYVVVGDSDYYFFDDRRLQPGEELVIHVGTGRNTDGHVYWGSGQPVLDDDGGTIRLVDGDTDRVIRLSY